MNVTRKQQAYALLALGALRYYYESRVATFKPDGIFSNVMSVLDIGGTPVTYAALAGGAYLLLK